VARIQCFFDSQIVKSKFVKVSHPLIKGEIQTIHIESEYWEIENRGNRGKTTSKVAKWEIPIRERGDQDRWIVGEYVHSLRTYEGRG
jgi:hypothetical protein